MPDSNENTVMPPAIAEAILKVMAEVKTIATEHKADPQQGGYAYASIDDFIAEVRQHLIAAELFVIQEEAQIPELKETKKKDGSPMMWWFARYTFTLIHSSGVAYGPVHRTVMVLATGAQAAGSAQSYSLKQYFRSLFQIPTGDQDDPDADGTAEMSSGQQVLTDMQKEYQRIFRGIQKAQTIEALEEFWTMNEVRIEQIGQESKAGGDALGKAFDAQRAALEQAEIGAAPNPLG